MASVTQYQTTLTAKVGVNDQLIQVANATGITNPGSLNNYNATPTFLQVDVGVKTEYMEVTTSYKTGSLIVPVIRGTQKASLQASNAIAHAAGVPVLITAENNVQPTNRGPS